MAYLLTNDLVRQIFVHLPLQSLFRFRTINKLWRDVIDSPLFRKAHISKNNDNEKDTVLLIQLNFWKSSIMLLDTGKSWGDDDDLPALRELSNGHLETRPGCIITESFHDLRVAGSVNGLVCIHSSLPKVDIYICNPSLGQIKILPSSPKCCHSHTLHVGIGFDNVVHDYKVVQLLSCDEHNCLHASIYSKMTNSWRDLVGDDQYLRIVEPVNGGGLAQWQASRVVGENSEDLILSFDMKSEVFRSFELPDFVCLRRLGYVKIIAKGGRFVLYNFDYNNWLNVYESRLEGNNCLRWDHVRKIGPFGVDSCEAQIWWNGCVVLNQLVLLQYASNPSSTTVAFYDYCDDKFLRSFEIPVCCRGCKVYEYKGGFVSP